MRKILTLLAMLIIIMPVFAGKMPDFKLSDMSGKDISLESLLGRGPVIIDFWADYCKPCKEAMPALNTLAEKYEDITVVMISIDAPKAQARAKSYLKSKNFKFVTLFDPDKKLAKQMNVVNPPHSFMLDNTGEIVYSHVGFEAGTEKVYEGHIRNMLGLKDEAEHGQHKHGEDGEHKHGENGEHCGNCGNHAAEEK
ncbi:MAG: TlpA disulfide reductase family protein [Candidatus Cloacimonetes bacterium]|nr:TlpA family protein disulfide reductase [Candidatus Cloacimonadota bacterium]MDD2505872.1 TlpA disulfide reductase family protein [Candidatus Cloacimonadota bacterium]MDD4148389.1 TlpA disulfide reductase family protein [Candidatus Cloacimonadota bacterium]MDD4559283.1 TlpA disulfide reductase family protein [Candidatus Cloacimonadota bacterium]